MWKKLLLVFGGFVMTIFLIGGLASWQIGNWKKSLPQNFPKIEPGEIQSFPQIFPTSSYPGFLPFGSFFPENSSETYKEFISPDGKLKVSYPANWIKIEIPQIEKTLPEKFTEDYDLKLLLFAQKFEGEKFAQLNISQMIIDSGKKIEEIVEEIKESNLERDWEMKIVKSEVGERGLTFEAKYRKEGKPTLYSRERFIALQPEEGKKKVFLVEFITFDKDWEGFEKEAEEILNSATIVE
jgi:hypothetical protein